MEQQLKALRAMVERQGGALPRILRTHFASLGAPDIVFEQEASDMAALEEQIAKVTESPEFQNWSSQTSTLLMQSPKREDIWVGVYKPTVSLYQKRPFSKQRNFLSAAGRQERREVSQN